VAERLSQGGLQGLPAQARVEAAPNFLSTLQAVREFFIQQDADSAEARFLKLKTQLREMVAVLAWSPASGRPARFVQARSAQAHLRVAAVLKLAEQAGLPYLREVVIDQHVVLYAHAETEVLLLAVKHTRQLAYSIQT
jgi:plasmid stabilization system protein ParE